MHNQLKKIEELALQLNPNERARLAEVLLDSLNAPLTEIQDTWTKEIEERVAAYDRGDIPTYPAEDVFAEANRISKQ